MLSILHQKVNFKDGRNMQSQSNLLQKCNIGEESSESFFGFDLQLYLFISILWHSEEINWLEVLKRH